MFKRIHFFHSIHCISPNFSKSLKTVLLKILLSLIGQSVVIGVPLTACVENEMHQFQCKLSLAPKWICNTDFFFFSGNK